MIFRRLGSNDDGDDDGGDDGDDGDGDDGGGGEEEGDDGGGEEEGESMSKAEWQIDWYRGYHKTTEKVIDTNLIMSQYR